MSYIACTLGLVHPYMYMCIWIENLIFEISKEKVHVLQGIGHTEVDDCVTRCAVTWTSGLKLRPWPTCT